jgi:serine/threonine protein kinase
MNKYSEIDALLEQWESSYEQGHELSAEELTKGCPNLLPEVKQAIKALKATEWMLETDGGDDKEKNTLSFKDDTTDSKSSRPIDEFKKAVIESGLISDEALESIESLSQAKNSLALATYLVTRKKLTPYQATVLLEGKKSPLILDKYVILDSLDSGGMGLVFKALHQTMDRTVALKTLPHFAVDSEYKIKRFQQEVRAAAMLHHANIATAYDAVSANDVHFLVMEYVKGLDLQKVVTQKGQLPVGTAVDYIMQAAKGLEHAHQQGIIHRDIKPANLMLDENETIKVLDLGLARIESTEALDDRTGVQDLTQTGSVMGTIAYMAPEQAKNSHTADHRSDIYSLGCTLHFLLTGQPPYKEKTSFQTLLAHREKEIPYLAEDRDDIPQQLDDIFDRMMEKDPEERFQSMTELITALEKCRVKHKLAPKKIIKRETTHQTRTSTKGFGINIPPINRYVAAGLVAFLFFGILAGILIKVNPKDGTITIESSHPDVEVFVDEKKVITLIDPNDNSKITIKVQPGEHTLKVTKGGLEATVSKFSLKGQNGKPIQVSLQFTENQPADYAKERKIAEWVLKIGGQLIILIDGEHVGVKSISNLPEKPFYTTNIYLQKNKRVKNADLARISGLTFLDTLSLLETSITDEGVLLLRKLPSLKTLDLFGTDVTGRSLKYLHEFAPNLTTLYLNYTKVMDGGFKHLKMLPELRTVLVGDNNYLSDTAIEILLTMKIERLNIYSNLITGEGLQVLDPDSHIRELGLGSNAITDQTLKHLIPVKLEKLSLHGTKITDRAIDSLKQIKTLKSLSLKGTGVTAEGIKTLREALPKCDVQWDGNKKEKK